MSLVQISWSMLMIYCLFLYKLNYDHDYFKCALFETCNWIKYCQTFPTFCFYCTVIQVYDNGMEYPNCRSDNLIEENYTIINPCAFRNKMYVRPEHVIIHSSVIEVLFSCEIIPKSLFDLQFVFTFFFVIRAITGFVKHFSCLLQAWSLHIAINYH